MPFPVAAARRTWLCAPCAPMSSNTFESLRLLRSAGMRRSGFSSTSCGHRGHGTTSCRSWLRVDGSPVGQVLYTHAFLDAPSRLVDVLVLSPVGIRPDRQRQSIGTRLIMDTLRMLSTR